MDIQHAIAHALSGEDFTTEEIARVFGHMMDGKATPAQIGGLLIALRAKGETAAEIAGAAQAMRAAAKPCRCPDIDSAVDTCGTGGDGSGFVNVSTMAAVVVAATGVRVAKHGNRALSSKSGSSDVLTELGVKVDAPVEIVERCLEEAKIAFSFCPGLSCGHSSCCRTAQRARYPDNLQSAGTDHQPRRRQKPGRGCLRQ